MRKGPWTPEEDATLAEMVALHGTKGSGVWVRIASHVPGHDAKQCRER